MICNTLESSLMQIDPKQITPLIAHCIGKKYETSIGLSEAYKKCKDVPEAKLLIFKTVPMKDLFAQIKTEEQFQFQMFVDGTPQKQAIVDKTMKDISVKIYQTWCW